MSITVKELALQLGAEAVGDVDLTITTPSEPLSATSDQLALAMVPAYEDDLRAGAARAAILWDGADWQSLGLKAAIFAPRSRYTMAGVTRVFEIEPETENSIHESAIIHPSAKLAEGASVAAFTLIGRNVKIGKNVRIMSHVAIAENTVIGDNALIYSGVKIGARVVIGDDFICQPNATIGSDGFSFVTPKPGAIEEAKKMSQLTGDEETAEFVRINSLGTVVLGDRVEVGAATTIDRGTIANTEVGDGTKLDNQVQIGHNVKVGRNCLICGQAGVAGSAVIGDNVVIGGASAVADHVTIGSNVIAAGMSGVASNVPPNRVIMGFPAVKLETNVENYKSLRRLPRLFRKVDELQKQVSKLLLKE